MLGVVTPATSCDLRIPSQRQRSGVSERGAGTERLDSSVLRAQNAQCVALEGAQPLAGGLPRLLMSGRAECRNYGERQDAWAFHVIISPVKA
jgi:hypothetical protein